MDNTKILSARANMKVFVPWVALTVDKNIKSVCPAPLIYYLQVKNYKNAHSPYSLQFLKESGCYCVAQQS